MRAVIHIGPEKTDTTALQGTTADTVVTSTELQLQVVSAAEAMSVRLDWS